MMTDSQARERIVNKDSLQKNIFLNAGAGSGKTESLVRRVLLLIENGSTMDSIVAITFTKEAARMFYDRIGRELRKASAEATAAGETARAERLTGALESIDQAFFGTIDSFCRKLLLEHPQEAGISSQFIPMERAAEQRDFREELFRAMQRTRKPYSLWEQYDELRDYGLGTRDFLSMIAKGWGVASFTLDPGTKPVDCVVDPAKMAECRKEAKWLIGTLENLFGRPNGSLSSMSAANEEKLNKIKNALGYKIKIAPYRAVVELDDFVMDKLPQTKQRKQLIQWAMEKKERQLRIENIGRLAKEVMPMVESFEANKYYKSVTFIEAFNTYILEEMEARGLVTFDSCLLAVIRMLRADAKQKGVLTSYIQSRYHHFLVDEYQDTSGLQSELFFRLAAETMEEDWKLTKLRPGALFIVGDEKQAIYRFRGGDVDNYMRVRDLFEGSENCEVLQLSCNFRSSKPMTEWFNGTFQSDLFMGKAFPVIEASEKQKRFGEQQGTADGVYLYKLNGKKGRRPYVSKALDEEEKILYLIKDLIGKPIFKYDHKTNTTSIHPITYDDIMIITSRKSRLEPYIKLLAKWEIPYSVAGNTRLSTNPVMDMMERLLDAAIHPGDKYKKLNCLLLPPFSLTEREIYLWNQKQEGTAAKQAFELLDQMTKDCRKKTPSALFGEMISLLQSWRWLELSNSDSMDTLYYGLELVRSEEAAGYLRNAEELLVFIDEELKNGGHEYEMSTEERSRGIKILNLHKSKGLEAPVVILADAEAMQEHKTQDCVDFETRTAYIADLISDGSFGVKITSTNQFDEEMQVEAEQLRREEKRLRYVAATRAENILLIPEMYENLGSVDPELPETRLEGRWDDYIKAYPGTMAYYDIDSKKFSAMLNKASDDSADDDGTDGTHAEPDILRTVPLDGTFSSDKTYETLNPSKVQLIETGEQESADTAAEDCEPVKGALTDDGSEDGASDGAGLIRTPERWRAVPATVLGTAVHRLMQAMVDRRYQMVDADHWIQVTKAILAEEAVAEEVREAAEEILINVAKTMCCGGYGQAADVAERAKCPWIPQDLPTDLMEELRGADEVYTELPFALYLPAQSPMLQELAQSIQIDVDSDGFINGIMDLIYYKDGQWIICDYKTNYHREGLYGHYEGQLLLYREIAKKLLDLPELPQAYLYHIPCKVAVE